MFWVLFFYCSEFLFWEILQNKNISPKKHNRFTTKKFTKKKFFWKLRKIKNSPKKVFIKENSKKIKITERKKKLSLSASVGSAYPYVGELTPISHRQLVMAFASFFFGLSQLYVPAVAWLVFCLNFNIDIFGVLNYRPWRLLIVLFALPGLFSAVALFFLPESPKYHMAQVRLGLFWFEIKFFNKTLFLLGKYV